MEEKQCAILQEKSSVREQHISPLATASAGTEIGGGSGAVAQPYVTSGATERPVAVGERTTDGRWWCTSQAQKV